MERPTSSPLGQAGAIVPEDRGGSVRAFLIGLLRAFVATLSAAFGRRTRGTRAALPAEEPEAVQAEGLLPESYARQLEGRITLLEGKIAFLTSVFDSTSDAVVIADLRGTITMFNRGAEGIFGLESAIAVGDNLFRLLAEGARQDGEHQDARRINQMLASDEEIRNLRCEFVSLGSAKVTPALVTINFVKDLSGERVAIVAVIKDNTEVEKLTQVDPLTGLYNRRAYDSRVVQEYERMSRGHTRLVSALFIDIDHFGWFNKEHGHQLGDEVLREVGKVLADSTRIVDMAARYGGEEFVVLLPGTDEAGAARLAERIRLRISQVRIQANGKPLTVTASIGHRTHRVGDGSVQTFIKEANMALLHAKKTGRNRVCPFAAAMCA